MNEDDWNIVDATGKLIQNSSFCCCGWYFNEKK
jgi:hypothetical protein